MPHDSQTHASEPVRELRPGAGGIAAEGDTEAIEFVKLTTRLYHEIAERQFPMDGEVRWFHNGLHVVSTDEKHIFQVPMDRVADLVRPRSFPLLPILVMTDAALHSINTQGSPQMSNQNDLSLDEMVVSLSEDAIKLCIGFFMFGSKATLNIHPPHNTLKENQAAFDELVAAGLITHSYEKRRDIHTYNGTAEAGRVSSSSRGKEIALAMLG